MDIYLPDMKFMDGEMAERFNEVEARDYPERTQEALMEMHGQVGDLGTNRVTTDRKNSAASLKCCILNVAGIIAHVANRAGNFLF